MLSHRIIVYGIVQNVGFRYNIQIFANKEGIKGFVRNLPNKSVEICFLGSENHLEKLKKYLKSNPGYSKVKQIEFKTTQIDKKFDNFEILY